MGLPCRRQRRLRHRHHHLSDRHHHRDRRHGHDRKRLHYSYIYFSGTWNVTNIASSQASATTTDSRFYYDELPFGQVALGNLTKQEDWISTTTYASSTKTYNAYGLVATSTDRRGYATGYKYDAFNLYVATATNPLGQQTQYLYNYANGKPKQTTDPNNRITKNIYDGVGRLIEVDQSDVSTPSLLATSTTYQYTDNTATPSIVHRADYLTATNTVDTYDYYDGLNRLVQERKASQTAGTYVATDRLYNPAGLLGSTSLPYFSSGSGFTSPTSISALYTTYTYDPLKRVLITSNAVGSTKNVYAKWTTTTTDPNGNVKDYTLDAFGNLAYVVEHIGGTLATTTYTYDAANNLATTTDSLGNVRAFTYDGLGGASPRKTCMPPPIRLRYLVIQLRRCGQYDLAGRSQRLDHDAHLRCTRPSAHGNQRRRNASHQHLRQLHQRHRLSLHCFFNRRQNPKRLRHSRPYHLCDNDHRRQQLHHRLHL